MSAKTSSLVDQLGKLKAEIAQRERLEEQLIAKLKALGDGSYEGKHYEACIFTQKRPKTDWGAIVKRCKIKSSIVTRYTEDVPVVNCKLTRRAAA